MSAIAKAAISALLLAGLLSACGLKGDLETPPPLWGDPNRTAADRDLPGARRGESADIVFTRDDVDIFNDGEEEDDPFADDEEEAEAPSDPAAADGE
ncbi:MAG: lipoprotein [Maricaulaceae bacterium]|jgi:predicted small lipoprotein YifL